jgi:phage tail P2-like protein
MNNELLPPNATAQEIALAAATSRISDVPVPIRTLYQPAAAPSQVLPSLAWSYSLDEWDTTWTEAQKRQAITDSIYVHRHKGTIGAVKRAVNALGFGVEVQEWFRQLPLGDPYTFRLLLTAEQSGIPQAGMLRLQDVVDATKNLRSHLSAIVPTIITNAGPTAGAVTVMGHEITVDGFEYSLKYDGSAKYDGMYRHNGIKVPVVN